MSTLPLSHQLLSIHDPDEVILNTPNYRRHELDVMAVFAANAMRASYQDIDALPAPLLTAKLALTSNLSAHLIAHQPGGEIAIPENWLHDVLKQHDPEKYALVFASKNRTTHYTKESKPYTCREMARGLGSNVVFRVVLLAELLELVKGLTPELVQFHGVYSDPISSYCFRAGDMVMARTLHAPMQWGRVWGFRATIHAGNYSAMVVPSLHISPGVMQHLGLGFRRKGGPEDEPVTLHSSIASPKHSACMELPKLDGRRKRVSVLPPDDF